MLTKGEAPKDQSVVITLTAALAEDESFAAYAMQRRSVYLTEDGNWDKLYRAAAATILEEYLLAVETGSWP